MNRSSTSAGPGPLRRRWVAIPVCSAWLFMGWMAIAPAGLAQADCTGAGDFGAGSGCPAPGANSGSGGGDSWPPTAVDWPPAQSADADGDTGAPATAPPIVLPSGQQAAPAAPATSDPSSPPKPPIVPVDAPATTPVATKATTKTTTVIVTPTKPPQ